MIETTQIKRNFRQIFEYRKKNWFSWWTKVKGKKFSWQTNCYITFVSTLFSHFSIIFLDDSRTPCLLFWNYRSIIASNDKWCDQRVTSMGQGKYLRAREQLNLWPSVHCSDTLGTEPQKDSWRAGPYTRFMYDMRPAYCSCVCLWYIEKDGQF